LMTRKIFGKQYRSCLDHNIRKILYGNRPS
jgi:hypothetical protein